MLMLHIAKQYFVIYFYLENEITSVLQDYSESKAEKHIPKFSFFKEMCFCIQTFSNKLNK